jgi:hypothetical protein
MATTFPFPASPTVGQQVTLSDGVTKEAWNGYAWEQAPNALGPLSTPLLLADGTMPAPSLAFASEPGLGWYRKSASIIANAAQGQITATLDSASTTTIQAWYPRSAPGRSWLYLANQPQGNPNVNSLQLFCDNNGNSYIQGGTSGSATAKPLTLDFPAGVILAPGSGAAALMLNTPPATTRAIQFQTSLAARWNLEVNTSAESGANVGSDFVINRFNDAGAFLSTAFSIIRSTGNSTFAGPLTAAGGLSTNVFNVVDSGGYPTIKMESTPANRKYLRVSGSDGNLEVVNAANSAVIARIENTGRVFSYFGYACKQGASGVEGASAFNFNWTGALQVWVDSTNLGTMNITSDERVKQAIEPLVLDAEAFAAIQPIKYRWADVGIFMDDGKDHWGFSAQNLMPIMPPTVVGDITARQENDDPQPASLDTLAILAQTVLQVQALMRDVATLKANIPAH